MAMFETRRRKQQTQVLVVDDHPIVRQGLPVCSGQESDIARPAAGPRTRRGHWTPSRNSSRTSRWWTFRCATPRHRTDQGYQDSLPRLPVLVLSMHQESFYAETRAAGRARGYVTKEEATEKVVQAIRQVLSGQVYLSDRMASKMLSKLVEGRPGTDGMSIERPVGPRVGGLRVHRPWPDDAANLPAAQPQHQDGRKPPGQHQAQAQASERTELLQYAVQWVQSEKGR